MRAIYARLAAFKPQYPLIMAVFGSCMLGISPIFVRLADIGPNAVGVYRIFFAMPLMYVWMKLEERANPQSHVEPRGSEWWLFILAGFFFSLDLATWHLSIGMTSIVNSSILNNLTPIFVPILLWLFYSEKPTVIYVLSALFAILGSAILTGSTFSIDADNFLGDMLAISSAVAYSGYIIVVKNLRGKFNAPMIMFWTSFSNVILLSIFTYIRGENFIISTVHDVIAVVGLVIFVQIFGQGLLAYSMGKLSAPFVSLTMLLGPIISAILGWIIFGESLMWLQTLGAVIVLLSIAAERLETRILREKK